jgi:hemerythrin-like domain-containing protein
MEKKPIKRNKHILQLSKDHHFTLLFCWKIRQGVKKQIDPERIKKYVQYFWQEHIQTHFREEEEILFKPVEDDKVQKALNDHQAIKNQVTEVLQLPNDISTEALLMLADMVDAHIRYEERALFPHLETVLTENQLELIGEQLDKQEIQKDNYQDEFWIKEKL